MPRLGFSFVFPEYQVVITAKREPNGVGSNLEAVTRGGEGGGDKSQTSPEFSALQY